MEKSNGCKVCVTGGAGYIGSWLVKKLLDKGYTVHATLRNLGTSSKDFVLLTISDDVSKVSLLKSIPGADARLVLFKADMYKPDEFESAIQGCEFVFHVATPFHHTEGSQYKSTTEAAIEAAKRIAMSCVKSGTVKRLIYTATVIAASPLKEDGSGFKDIMDETCWTPLNLSIPYSNDFLKGYQDSKTLAEKEILSFINQNGGPLEVVTLDSGLVGGDTLLSFTPSSVAMLVCQLTNNAIHYGFMKYMEELLGKIPIVHIDDVCEAHIFCMENSSVSGRFLCANSYISCAEMASYHKEHYPHFHVEQEYLEGPKRKIALDFSKLTERGFVYKYNTKMILDDCISCARRMGDL